MNPMNMIRQELVEELRKYTTKAQLDRLLQGSTAGLRSRLAYHLSPEAERRDMPIPLPIRRRIPTPQVHITVLGGCPCARRSYRPFRGNPFTFGLIAIPICLVIAFVLAEIQLRAS